MAFEYLSNVALEEAVEGVVSARGARGMAPCVETVTVGEALGRITAEPLYAAISAPHYHACAMDGIAVASRATFGATATTPVTLQPGDYVVVDTGDPLPAECDAVIMVEDLVYDDGQSVEDLGRCPVTVFSSVAPWGNVRQIGEDICAGEMLLTSNARIEPAAMGAMLAAGVQEVRVIARPKVGIIPTGDEVVAPSANPQPGDVMEFNSTIFSGMVRKWGGEPVVYPIVPDKPNLVKSALQQAAGECDIVLLNAGSSAGRDDYSSRAVAEVGELLYHGIAIKPGKPAILGCAGEGGSTSAIIGVPGYPVSGIIVVEALVRPLLERLLGCSVAHDREIEATLARPCTSSLKYREFVRVRLGVVGDKTVELVAWTYPPNVGLYKHDYVYTIESGKPRQVLDNAFAVYENDSVTYRKG
ncbi:MAG: hypothetical protein IJ087_20185, partial [Eggerthellaceae bacterium]|nr:hypothetical protein [Eggerthellaceae bacterium]